MSFNTTHTTATFEKRIRRIHKEREALHSGRARHVVGKDGLIVVKKHNVLRRSFPMRAVVLLVLCFVALKVFLFTSLGQEAYLARLPDANEAGIAGQIGAFLMQVDPVTVWLSQTYQSFMS